MKINSNSWPRSTDSLVKISLFHILLMHCASESNVSRKSFIETEAIVYLLIVHFHNFLFSCVKLI